MNFFKKDEAIFMNSVPTENPLGYEPLPRLLKSFAVPSIIAMLVSSLYNIVDQVFIGQESAISVMQLLMLRFL